MKIALVHDYLREYGGAERVVEAIHEMWPEAPLYTSFVDWGNLGGQGYRFRGWDIRTAQVELIPGIRRIPGIGKATDWIIKKYHSPLRFLAPKIWESFNLSDYDAVISSSGWFMCRGVANQQPTTHNKQLHICYIHHPPRNLYGYATGSDLQKYWPIRVYATVVNFFLRHYDWETAQKVDYFIANSDETKRRVWKFYRREATVIYPPVVGAISNKKKSDKQEREEKNLSLRSYFLSVGRFTYSKRVDLAIEACNTLKLPLKIVGTGKEEGYLRKLASPAVGGRSRNIEFLGSVSDEELAKLYAGAKALIFCALDEDFGIVPVEAMAHGVPVIGLGQGGVLETVVDGKTGIVFNEPTVDSLVTALKEFLRLKKDWSAGCIAQAKKFSKKRFQTELRAFVEKTYAGKLVSSN